MAAVKKWTPERMAEAYLDWIHVLGCKPTREDWEKPLKDDPLYIVRPSSRTVRELLGSWEALEKAAEEYQAARGY